MSTFLPMLQRAKVRQWTSLVCSSLRVFHVAVQSFLASFSLFSWPIFIQVRPLQASLAPPAHKKSVGSTSASDGTDRFQSVKIDITASLLKQPLLNDLLAVLFATGKVKMLTKLSVGRNMKKGEAVVNLARLSTKASAKDAFSIAEREDRDLILFDRRFVGPKQTSCLQLQSAS